MTTISCNFNVNRDLIHKLKQLKLNKAVERVGWFEGLTYDDGTPVAKVALINEFGATIKVTDKMRRWFAAQGFPLNKHTTEIHIPARSFIRSTVDEKQKDWGDTINKLLKKVFDGELTLEQVLETWGIVIESDVRLKINQIMAAGGNSPMTIAMKGKDTPLFNTGTMQRTLTHKTEIE